MTEAVAIQYMELGLQSMELQRATNHPDYNSETHKAFKITVRLAKERIAIKESKTIISEVIKDAPTKK